MADALVRFRAPRPHAADGDEDKVPRIALDETPLRCWSLTTLAGWRGHPRHPTRQDRTAVALALFKAWQDAKVPCPRVIVYLVEAGAHRMVLLTRLIFARPPAGDGLTAEELDSLAAAARRTLVMRGRRSATATAQLAPADDVDQFGELARERKEAEVRFGERLAAVLGTPV